jgi:hypothetical protein
MLGRYRGAKAHATGEPLDVQVVRVWDLKDGKLVRFQQYLDTLHLPPPWERTETEAVSAGDCFWSGTRSRTSPGMPPAPSAPPSIPPAPARPLLSQGGPQELSHLVALHGAPHRRQGGKQDVPVAGGGQAGVEYGDHAAIL